MVYNLNQPLDVQNAKTRLELLIKRGCIVEIVEKKPKRSLNQNAYLHLLLGYFASQTGNTLEWVKQQYYKKLCNPDIFIGEREDLFLGRVKYVRSSADLRVDEMKLSIDRFRNWSASEAGIYLPEATSEAELASLAIEVEKYKTYLY
ncbi:MAG: recombination protein NinB [Bacilli bacterium]|nr:recombination protein NinB [Bacilli bacterium]